MLIIAILINVVGINLDKDKNILSCPIISGDQVVINSNQKRNETLQHA